jgi:large conductance mechanosensitive channel
MKNMRKKTVNLWQEFKEFAFKGNMIELAVGIIIGAGFNNLVQSLVKDIIMPPVGKILGNVDFTNLYINLSDKHYATLDAATKAGAPVIRYGVFFNELINFIILATTIFLVLKLFLGYKAAEKK